MTTRRNCPYCGLSVGQPHKGECDISSQRITCDCKDDKSRTAEDVYWHYVNKYGLEAAQHAVVAYFDRETVVDLLLNHIDVEGLEEFLVGNLAEDGSHLPIAQPTEQSMEDTCR